MRVDLCDATEVGHGAFMSFEGDRDRREFVPRLRTSLRGISISAGVAEIGGDAFRALRLGSRD